MANDPLNYLSAAGGMDEKTALADPTLCPNCYGKLPKQTKTTPTGIEVCDDICVNGWMNGESAKRMWDLVHSFPGMCSLCPDHAASIAKRYPALHRVGGCVRSVRD